MRLDEIIQKLKETLPFWGFPLLLLVLALIIWGVVSGGGSTGASKPMQFAWSSNPVEAPEQFYDVPVQPTKPRTKTTGAGTTTPKTQAASTYTASSSNETSATMSAGTEVPGQDATFVFKCYGRAHGVGLCMDGVRYRALAGQSAEQIVNYYYTGVQITQSDDSKPIRVKGRDGSVRTLSMKEYLYHLSEEPEDYPAEGLKVLYMAARTYALNVIARGKHTSSGYDICSSGECCQAFDENKNLAASPNNMAAVDATAGQIITYDGAPITAAYCGSCGGHTDSAKDVFGTDLPYLIGKPDSYCSKSDRFCTEKEISVKELASRVDCPGQLKLIDLSDRTPGGRVRNVRIVGTGGTRTMKGKALADIFGFRGLRYEYSFK